jgi:hypothetical protein
MRTLVLLVALGLSCAGCAKPAKRAPVVVPQETIEDPHYYSYQFESAGKGHAAAFTATAMGDLDCDDDYSTFELTGRIQPDGSVHIAPDFFIDKKLE